MFLILSFEILIYVYFDCFFFVTKSSKGLEYFIVNMLKLNMPTNFDFRNLFSRNTHDKITG